MAARDYPGSGGLYCESGLTASGPSRSFLAAEFRLLTRAKGKC
jgi:hypothetical protein